MGHESGGDPTRSLKWCRTTPAKIAQALRTAGIQVGASTVRRLLKNLLGYSLRVNHKKIESGIKNPPPPGERDRQFEYIGHMRESCARRGIATLSVDTKKKDLIGNFKNDGSAWRTAPRAVKDHDYPSDAVGRMVPFGIYDTQANQGFVCVGTSGDTPRLLPWTPLSAGGSKRAAHGMRRPQNWCFWPTAVAATATAAGSGSTACKSSCATSTI